MSAASSVPSLSTPEVSAPAGGAGRARGQLAELVGVLWQNRKARVGLIMLGVFVLVAIIGPYITPYSPFDSNFAFMLPPSAAHPLGTTQNGQDVFSELIYGTRVSVLIAFAVGAVATFLSMLVGITAAYVGGWVDDILSFLTNVFLVLPGLPLLIVLASYEPNGGTGLIILIIGLTGWPWGARVLRSQVATLRNRDFVVAARLAGDGTARIIAREIVPNMLSLLMANFLGASIAGLLAAVGLQFLGFGDPSQVSWGTMLYWANNSSALLVGGWAWIIAPGLCIALFGMSLVLVNFGVDAISNPRLQEES
jgi:peptide/nickel transport system permease protein